MAARRRRRIRLVDTSDEQLSLWLDGVSVHQRSHRRGESFRCCPDFSCCHPALLQPVDVRREFVQKPKNRAAMLVCFLGLMIESATKPSNRVYITDGETRILTHGRT